MIIFALEVGSRATGTGLGDEERNASDRKCARLELALRNVFLSGDHVPAGVVVVLRVLQHIRAGCAEVGPPLHGVVCVPSLCAHHTLSTAS